MTWLLSFIPWWVWALLILAAIGAVQAIFGWKAAVGAAIAALPILGALWGRNEGAKDAQAKRDREAIDHIRTRKEIDDDVAEMGAQDIDQNLARWNRDE